MINASNMSSESIKLCLRSVFEYLGEDPDREGLQETPERMIRSWEKIFGGYLQRPEDILTIFKEDEAVPTGQLIMLKDIDFYSTCEHHFLPFIGKVHVAYVPSDRVIGISKLARIVEIYSRRLQIQERIGQQVTVALMTHLKALGAACVIEGEHLCMSCRGVEKQNSVMTTSSYTGVFMTDRDLRLEFLTMLRKGG